MKLNFTNGIEITIDDNKIISWGYYLEDKNRIIVTMKDHGGIIKYLFDKDKEIFKRID